MSGHGRVPEVAERRGARFWAAALGIALAAAIVVAGAVAVVTGGRPALELVRIDDPELVEPIPTDCGSRRKDPAGADIWDRQWQLSGEVEVDEATWRGVPAGEGRALVLWRDFESFRAMVPDVIEGGWYGTGVNFFASSDRGAGLGSFGDDAETLFVVGAGGNFGLMFDLVHADADRLCRLNLSFPSDRGNTTIGFPTVRPLRWTDLEEGERDTARTVTHTALVSVTRTGKARWRLSVEPDGTPQSWLASATVTIAADAPRPPWDHIEIDVEASGNGLRSTWHLELSPPVHCPGDNGFYSKPC